MNVASEHKQKLGEVGMQQFLDQCAKYGTGHTNALHKNIPVPRIFAKKYTRIPEKYTNQQHCYPI